MPAFSSFLAGDSNSLQYGMEVGGITEEEGNAKFQVPGSKESSKQKAENASVPTGRRPALL